MGNCARFGAVNGDGLPRQKDRRERERVCVCCCAVLRRTGRRKESYNVGAPHEDFIVIRTQFLSNKETLNWQITRGL